MNEMKNYKDNFLLVFFHSAPTTAKLNGQTTPLDVSGLSQNEIQGLLLGSHPSAASAAATATSPSATTVVVTDQQNISVKREPEDLRMDPKCEGRKVSFQC